LVVGFADVGTRCGEPQMFRWVFVEWRYFYETGLVDTDLGFLQRFAAAIQGVLKEYP
jgi:hypothetical protein